MLCFSKGIRGGHTLQKVPSVAFSWQAFRAVKVVFPCSEQSRFCDRKNTMDVIFSYLCRQSRSFMQIHTEIFYLSGINAVTSRTCTLASLKSSLLANSSRMNTSGYWHLSKALSSWCNWKVVNVVLLLRNLFDFSSWSAIILISYVGFCSFFKEWSWVVLAASLKKSPAFLKTKIIDCKVAIRLGRYTRS